MRSTAEVVATAKVSAGGSDPDVEVVELTLPAMRRSLRSARSTVAQAAAQAGVPATRAAEVGLATDELCLAVIDDLARGGVLLVRVTKGRFTVRVSGRGVGEVRSVAALGELPATIVGALFPRYTYTVDGSGPSFAVTILRPGARSTRPLRRAEEAALLHAYTETGDRALRNRLVEAHRGLAVHVARRYQFFGEPIEDLIQVASIGLVKALERYDPSFGVRFTTYATSTIDGELKRHFRDATWAMRVPRAVQELHLHVRNATTELAQTLEREPTDGELGLHLGVSGMSLDLHLDASPDGSRLANDDAGFVRNEDAVAVARLTARLGARDREILRLRFVEQRSQSEIAAVIGVSQMHVSRLLTKVLERLRTCLVDADA
jgi:RNA polymerase sigma-B factor